MSGDIFQPLEKRYSMVWFDGLLTNRKSLPKVNITDPSESSGEAAGSCSEDDNEATVYHVTPGKNVGNMEEEPKRLVVGDDGDDKGGIRVHVYVILCFEIR